MSVLLSDVVLYGAANMPEADSATVGGTLTRMIYTNLIHVAGAETLESGHRSSIYKAGKKPAGLVIEERTVRVVSHLTPTEQAEADRKKAAEAQAEADRQRELDRREDRADLAKKQSSVIDHSNPSK